MPADLHLHTKFSDGTNSPSDVVSLAHSLGIDTISITDHDTIDGLSEAINAGKLLNITVIPGIEFTAEVGSTELHILGYFFDINNENLLAVLNKVQNGRKDRIVRIVDKLNELGINVTPSDVFEKCGNNSPGRPHVAKVMIDKGYVTSMRDAFGKYLQIGAPAYVGHFKLLPKEVIEIILQAKGIPIFAHPAVSDCDNLIPTLVEQGLKGIEVFYATHDSEQIRRYKEICEKHNLLMTGGSDFHGVDSGRRIKMGDILLEDKYVDMLKGSNLL